MYLIVTDPAWPKSLHSAGSQAIMLLFKAWFAVTKAKENVQVLGVRLPGAGPQGRPSCVD